MKKFVPNIPRIMIISEQNVRIQRLSRCGSSGFMIQSKDMAYLLTTSTIWMKAGFDKFCKGRKIIPLYMPSHSFHLPTNTRCQLLLSIKTSLWPEGPGYDTTWHPFNWEERFPIYLSHSPSTCSIFIKYLKWIFSNWAFPIISRPCA